MFIGYRSLARTFLAITLTFLVACEDNSQQPNLSMMTTEEIIRHYADAPIEDSIGPVTQSLADTMIFLASDSSSHEERTEVTLDALRFRVGTDGQGREWAYVYTSQNELIETFGEGTPYIELSFRDFFEIAVLETLFAGIFINSGSEDSYPIPRELFDDVRNALDETGGG